MDMEEAVEAAMKSKGIENLKAATMNMEEASEALHSWGKGLIPAEDVKESMEQAHKDNNCLGITKAEVEVK